MADVPPVFADLGKAARDVFNKGFGKYMYVHNENQTNIRRECESEHVWHKLPCSLIEVVSHVHVLELYGVGEGETWWLHGDNFTVTLWCFILVCYHRLSKDQTLFEDQDRIWCCT